MLGASSTTRTRQGIRLLKLDVALGLAWGEDGIGSTSTCLSGGFNLNSLSLFSMLNTLVVSSLRSTPLRTLTQNGARRFTYPLRAPRPAGTPLRDSSGTFVRAPRNSSSSPNFKFSEVQRPSGPALPRSPVPQGHWTINLKSQGDAERRRGLMSLALRNITLAHSSIAPFFGCDGPRALQALPA